MPRFGTRTSSEHFGRQNGRAARSSGSNPQERLAMPADIRVGSLELRFLCSKHDTGGGLGMFGMICPPDGRMPVPHSYRHWDEAIYWVSRVVTFTADGK